MKEKHYFGDLKTNINNKPAILFEFSLLFVLAACSGEDGADGIDGTHGKSASVQTSVLGAGDANCPKGGIKVEVLIDGAVQDDQTRYVCHGANGLNGADGEQGPQGTPGANGLNGADGKDSVCAGKVAPEVEAELEFALIYQLGKTYSWTMTANKAGLKYQFIAPNVQIELVEAEAENDGKFVSTWNVTPLAESSNAVIIATDGCQMTLVEIRFEDILEMISIPAGTLPVSGADPVELEAFVLAKTPTTVSQFEACVDAGACTLENYYAYLVNNSSLLFCNYERGNAWLNHPMNCVNWYGATQFCEWIGGRLPTEAEWQYAATHDGTQALGTTYPWGDTAPTQCRHANYYDEKADHYCNGTTKVPSANRVGTSAVGTYSPLGDSPLGLQDMAGNVAEWTSSKNGLSTYVIKSFSWSHIASKLSVGYRDWISPWDRGSYFGFRCAADSR